jgi:hypothetical protein
MEVLGVFGGVVNRDGLHIDHSHRLQLCVCGLALEGVQIVSTQSRRMCCTWTPRLPPNLS